MKFGPSIAILAALALSCAAQAQTTYRWVDPGTGRTVFSDQPPPPGAKVLSKQEGGDAADERQPSYAAKVAAEKFPVVLYTSADCTEHCAKGRELLNRRGVPFQEKMVQPGSPDLEELKRLSGGEAFVPLIVIGRQNLKGFDQTGWDNLLDLAGYPKTAPFGSRPAPTPLAQ